MKAGTHRKSMSIYRLKKSGQKEQERIMRRELRKAMRKQVRFMLGLKIIVKGI